jgi:uncharacterized membrane protein (DUF2068 family)
MSSAEGLSCTDLRVLTSCHRRSVSVSCHFLAAASDATGEGAGRGFRHLSHARVIFLLALGRIRPEERQSGIRRAHTITEMASGAMISRSRYEEAWVKVMGDGHGPDRWESIVCGCRGHITYATDQPALNERLSGTTALGEVWRCLRCGEFTLGTPHGRGRADDAPLVLRGKVLRQAGIVRALAIERGIRAVLIGLAAWAVWKFRSAQGSLQTALDRDLPLLRASGIKVDQMTAISELEKALAAKPSTLTLLTVVLLAYAVLELVEGVGLWLLKRWGECFAVVATAVFVPLEVYDLTRGLTLTRALTFTINIAAVVYLLVSKRLFGLRGGRQAYDDERHGEQLLEVERAATTH